MYNVNNYSDTFTGANDDTFTVKMIEVETSVCTSCIRRSCAGCEFYEGGDDLQ